jgi:hypothetical protein
MSTTANPLTSHANGACWPDAAGHPIQAHGGGILHFNNAYYWYGENRDVPLKARGLPSPGPPPKLNSIGVSCYRSTDLLTWRHLGVVLPPSDDPTHDLHPSNVIERPKVLFNHKTGHFVMWLHVDSPDYKAARAGVAVADSPAGPFRYLRSLRPQDSMSRDQTLFLDDDGRAYHVTATDDNATTLISVLSDDFLSPTKEHARTFPNRFMEAFALCKRDGHYHLLASGCTGWKPNAARSALTDNLLGPWHEHPNPCSGPDADLTYHAQSTFILPPTRPNDPYTAMFDLWRPSDLRTSGYTWLPVTWQHDRMTIPYHPTWPAR